MKSITEQIKTVGKATVALSLGVAILGAGFVQATPAQAFWWWPNHAHAEEGDDMVTVTIKKYIDGEAATVATADSVSFPMMASWNDEEGVGEGSGNYALSSDTSPAYQAKTAELNKGSSYSTNEVLDGANVSAACTVESSKPFALVGYSVGSTLAQAKAAAVSTTSPSFTDLQQDKYVIVWNKSCDDNATTTPGGSSGEITGTVTGGQTTEDPGDLEVTSVEAKKTTATANGQFTDGWQYVFNITVPTDEPNLAMKFANWVDENNAAHTIPVANNMRISSAQASASSTVLLTAANTYSSPDLHMTGDLDPTEEGLQVKVLVEVAIPTSTFNGNYSTNYGVRTLE
ncbi:MAG: hypothetical protein KBD50_00435 [Candidatus Pacebacteria bacterium]|nr:hypothetical protein [Candidatus Paceibacterota bacterium]